MSVTLKRYTSEVLWDLFVRYGPGGGGREIPEDYRAKIEAHYQAGLSHLQAAKALATETGWDDFGPMPEDN